MDKKKVALILAMAAVITALHYLTPVARVPLHILFREFYFIPIILAGLWGGKKIGLATSLSISIAYIPHIFILAKPQPIYDSYMMMNILASTAESYWGNALQVLLFNLAGLMAGAYFDTKHGYVLTKSRPYHPTEFRKNFLLFVEDSETSLYGAKYFADVFGNISDINVTLLWVTSGTDSDYFETEEEASGYEKNLAQKGQTLLAQAKELLINGGIGEDAIQLRNVTAGKERKISEKIMEQLSEGNYDTIVLAKHPMSKSQEFLFGSVAVNLVRQASINVLTVKSPSEGNFAEDASGPAAASNKG